MGRVNQLQRVAAKLAANGFQLTSGETTDFIFTLLILTGRFGSASSISTRAAVSKLGVKITVKDK